MNRVFLRPTKPDNFVPNGFTLIELLVVIAIIALLAAILFPVFARARENARKSSCLNNTKQIGIGLQQYSQDFDENLVLNGTATTPSLQWPDLLQPYVKSAQVLVCPSHTTPYTTGGGRKCSYTLNNYYYNNSTLGQIFEQGSGGPVSMASIEDVAGTVFMGDGTGFQFATGTPTWNATANPQTITSGQSAFVARHLDQLNIAFLDGHSKALKPEKIVEVSGGNYRYFTKIRD